MNQEVTNYIQNAAQWQAKVCTALREMLHKTIPDVEERLQYGKPHYLKNGHYLAVIHAGKDKVSFMLFNASSIAEEQGFLRSMGNGERKTVDIQEGQAIDYDHIATLVREASTGL
jgi:hypothetical protein